MRLLIIDRYIIRKFLGTFFFSLLIILSISVIFDLSEKIDNFLEKSAPLKAIVFDYYLNFIPFFGAMFMPLFTFISVIFFTSKMAYNTEVIAILSSGFSFNRLLRPYFIAATLITILSFYLSNFVIPGSTKRMLAFEEQYYHNYPVVFSQMNVHRQVEPGVIVYFERFDTYNNYGRNFSLELYQDDRLTSKLLADDIRWDDEKGKWTIRNYYIRTFLPDRQLIYTGMSLDTTLNIHPDDFKMRGNAIQAMGIRELNAFIESQRLQGTSELIFSLLEKYKRFSVPFSTFILTLIGVSVSSRKVKGGIGLQIGIGLGVSFSYIFFMQFSQQFAVSGVLPPLMAVWLPNVLFAFIAYLLYRFVPR